MSEDLSLRRESESIRRSDFGEEEFSSEVGLGIIGDPEYLESISRAIVRAKDHGMESIVVVNERWEDFATITAELGATVIEVEDSVETEMAKSHLTGAAKAENLHGIALYEPPVQKVDFARSAERVLEGETYVEEVITEMESHSPEVLVGIPAYNESETITEIVEEVSRHADEVIVVDDGSTDRTQQLAEEAGATVVAHARNLGYGNTLQTIFKEAAKRNAEHLAIIDADGQHHPEDVPTLVDELDRKDADILIGSRFASGGETNAPMYRRFGLFVVNSMTNISLGVIRSRSWVSDTQSGFRVYSNHAITVLAEESDEIGGGMDASTDILYQAHKHNLTTEECGVHIDYQVTNGSHQHPVRHGLVLVSNLLRTIETQRPITLVGLPGLLSLLIGIGFAYWAFSNFVNSGVFPNGVALVAVFFGLLGVFATFTSIILHALNTKFDS